MPMVEPDVVEKRFKKYIRVSLENSSINLWKSRKKKNDSELLKSEVFFVEKELSDEYCFLENSVNVMGFDMIIRDDLLYETLKGLEQKHRDIIYLSCCEEWSDMKIGRKFNVPRSTIQYIKSKLKKEIYKKLSGDDNKGYDTKEKKNIDI